VYLTLGFEGLNLSCGFGCVDLVVLWRSSKIGKRNRFYAHARLAEAKPNKDKGNLLGYDSLLSNTSYSLALLKVNNKMTGEFQSMFRE